MKLDITVIGGNSDEKAEIKNQFSVDVFINKRLDFVTTINYPQEVSRFDTYIHAGKMKGFGYLFYRNGIEIAFVHIMLIPETQDEASMIDDDKVVSRITDDENQEVFIFTDRQELLVASTNKWLQMKASIC